MGPDGRTHVRPVRVAHGRGACGSSRLRRPRSAPRGGVAGAPCGRPAAVRHDERAAALCRPVGRRRELSGGPCRRCRPGGTRLAPGASGRRGARPRRGGLAAVAVKVDRPLCRAHAPLRLKPPRAGALRIHFPARPVRHAVRRIACAGCSAAVARSRAIAARPLRRGAAATSGMDPRRARCLLHGSTGARHAASWAPATAPPGRRAPGPVHCRPMHRFPAAAPLPPR